MKATLTTILLILLTGLPVHAVSTVREKAIILASAPYEHIQEAFIQIHRELADCLQTVHNKETADQATDTVVTLTKRLEALRAHEAALPAPPAVVVSYLRKKYRKRDLSELCEQSVGKALDLTSIEEPSCYGSEQLQHPLNKLLTEMAGGNMK